MATLVTGASGYIGCALAHALAESGVTVHALIHSPGTQKILHHPNIKIFRGDILDTKSIDEAMKDCEYVFHTAAFVRKSAADPKQFFNVNVTGTKNVLQSALDHAVKKFVFTSTCGVWGVTGDIIYNERSPRISPYDNDYEISKLLAEKAVHEFYMKGLTTVIVNPSKVFGPGLNRYSNAVNNYIQSFLKRELIFSPSYINAQLNYAFIDDVVTGHIRAMQQGIAGEKYILGGENISYKDFYKGLMAYSSKKKIIIAAPKWIMVALGACEEIRAAITKTNPAFTSKILLQLAQSSKFSSAKAIKELQYNITPFEQAIKTTINFIKNKNG